jgi:UDP-N-acetylglucosamine--N-acetylmuramyl-(pentapeptide) pyrophosphoryl-undecaprenol N-acetylglucosamine transferase
MAGYFAARRFLDAQHVAAVVGLGGYASVPMARAAIRRGVPLVLLEQNAVAGKATRWLAHSATMVCAGLPQICASLRCPMVVTGNPIRPGFGNVKTRVGPSPSDSSAEGRLLVLGGSSGARSLNEHLPQALSQIREKLSGWQIVHQSGPVDETGTRQLYEKLRLQATVQGFIDDMPEMLSRCDLAVCRSGGTTLAELAAAGVPAVLLPYPHATDDHQLLNAQVFATAGGALILDQRGLSGRLTDRLADLLAGLVGDQRRRIGMSTAMRRLARPHAAAEVAARILQAAKWRSSDSLPAAA